MSVDILFLSSKHPPKDKRVFDKEAISLAKAGFRVAHLAPGKEGSSSERGVEIHTYAEPRTLVDRVLQIPRLMRMARELDAACYHCNEVDSWFVGVLLKLATRRKLVFDVHELYPAEFAEGRFPPVMRPFVSAAVRAAIRVMMPFTDRIVLAKESAAPDYKGSEAKQIVVRNFTSVEASGDAEDRRERKPSGPGDRIKVAHIGGMTPERGWPQLIEALKEPGLERIDLLLLGDFPYDDQPAFEAAAIAAGLAGRYEIVPWLPFRDAFRRLAESDIGLVLLQPGRLNHVHALPHKLFDYMLAELPVIVPDFAVEVARIVREAECGILSDPSDSHAIANALRRLANDDDERKRLGARGRRAVLERYNWELEAATLVEGYVELFREV